MSKEHSPHSTHKELELLFQTRPQNLLTPQSKMTTETIYRLVCSIELEIIANMMVL